MKKWSTKEQLTDLLCDLISIPSISESEAEKRFSDDLTEMLGSLVYFQEHPEHLQQHPTGDGRSVVTALVKSGKVSSDTVILLSHFDVVETDCYGEWQPYAFDVKKLTELFRANPAILPERVRLDAGSGEWLFGRGVMDMKCGLALHMSMIERACCGEFDGNVLFVTVPDEEVNSTGMRAAVPALLDISERYGLQYSILLNSEPMYIPQSGERLRYLEKGSIGKLLPGFLCYGGETHVAFPFEGLNGNYMAAQMTCEMELDTSFSERIDGLVTPPPTNLIQNSLITAYSVTIPYRAVTMFNLMLKEKTADQVMEPLLAAANRAARKIEAHYGEKAKGFPGMETAEVNVRVLTYEELYMYACETFGQEKADGVVADALIALKGADYRQATSVTVDALALLCKQMAPMIVLFFAPPYYPSISSRNHFLIERLSDEIADYAEQRFDIELKANDYHAGITDLSYVGKPDASGSNGRLVGNMPLWEKGYSIPFKEMERFVVPVMNMGPLGMDPHKWTERLDSDYSLRILPELLFECICKVFYHNKNE
ncbi:M20/M25/M40 family metallo-hydrolase [Cohnella sp.]|uniref:M20/M25/M40 family metallo-hydrolase n=1 Tax=Cohnella sp. TaxID=1883426 RepID=UPI003569CEB8